MNTQYFNQLTKNYGKTNPYQYTGPKCTKDCQRFAHYETKHSKDCPFYKGSLSEKNDKPDGVHSFEQINVLALDWKKKYYDTFYLLQNQLMDNFEFILPICKAVGINPTSGSFMILKREQKLVKILQRITELNLKNNTHV